MKVAVLVNELDIRGGTHKQVLRFCQYLKAQNVDFKIYTKYCDISKSYPEFANFDIVSLKKDESDFYDSTGSIVKKIENNYKYIQEQKELYKLIPEDTDIINVHDMGFPWLMYWARKRKKCSTIWQINDLPACFRVGNGQNLPDSKFLKIKRKLYRIMVKHVNRITVNVTKNKERVQKCLNRNAEVLYCGVDVNHNLRMHSSNDFKDTINILSVGVFLPYRNYETLVSVIGRLHENGINAYLNIIGSTALDNEYSVKIEKLIETYNLQQYIHIYGQVDDQTYNDLFNEANIFAFININQSWGLAVFEAMSCGLPVIVSNSVGAIELLHNGSDSIIVDPLDVDIICSAIKKLSSDGKYYNALAAKGAEETKEYTWDNLYSSRMVQIFEQEVEKNKQ